MKVLLNVTKLKQQSDYIITVLMYDESEFGKIIKSKKERQTNDEGPVSKKAKKKHQKNLNRTHANTRMLNEYSAKQQETKKQMIISEKPKVDQSIQMHKAKVAQVKAISPNHKDSTILEQLKKYDFNLNDTVDALMGIQEDEDENSSMIELEVTKKPAKKSQEEDTQINAQKLMNQLYDQLGNESVEMNSQEFDELFEEITYIIQQDQKQKGIGLYEINQFVDSCASIKDNLLEGLEQTHIDQDDPLVHQTQLFLEDIIKKKVVYELKQQDQFPTLGSINSSKTQAKGKNYIEQIQEDYRQQRNKQSFFTPSKVPTNIVHEYNSNASSIYSIGENPHAYADIQQLSKQYNGMSIDSLKFIHHQLHDLNTCKMFLEKYYSDKRYKIKVEEKKKPVKPKVSMARKNIPQAVIERKKSVDADFKNVPLSQIREQLDHLFKVRSLFKLTKTKTTNKNYRKQLQRLACKDDGEINKLCEIARQKLVEQMAESNPQFVDLHGYRQEQIDETFDSIRKMVISEFRKGNSKIKTEKYGSDVYIIVRGMTGKGRHSRYGKSVLKPVLMQWAAYHGYKAIETEDSIEVYIKVV